MVMNVRKMKEMLLPMLSHRIQMKGMQSAPASEQNISQKLFLHTFMRQLEDTFRLTPRQC